MVSRRLKSLSIGRSLMIFEYFFEIVLGCLQKWGFEGCNLQPFPCLGLSLVLVDNSQLFVFLLKVGMSSIIVSHILQHILAHVVYSSWLALQVRWQHEILLLLSFLV